MAKRFLVLIALLLLGFFIAGCAEGDKKSSVTNPNPSVFTPTGSISGVVFDMCKQAPVQGAVVSVAYAGGVHQVTTGATGGFSFTGVPAVEENAAHHTTAWEQENGTDYTVTCDLTKVTGYGYAMVNSVEVVYSDLGDGTNSTLAKGATESGSGASTPVNGLAATTEFDVSPLTSTITGTVFDITSGRAPIGATISLYLGERLMAAPVVSTNGTFSFADVPAAYADSYYLEVTLAGYDYATSDGYAVGKYISGSNPTAAAW
ncbi:MAG: carboxypeptidase regulatory-like domain-containing protein [Desulfomonilia bacterium]